MTWFKKIDPVNTNAVTAEPDIDYAAAQRYSEKEPCEHCGGFHIELSCKRIRKFKTYSDGTKEVEYWPWERWPKTDIIFPDLIQIILAAKEEKGGTPSQPG